MGWKRVVPVSEPKLTDREIAEGVVAKWFFHEWTNQRPRPDEAGRDKLIELIEAALEQRVKGLDELLSGMANQHGWNPLGGNCICEWHKKYEALAEEDSTTPQQHPDNGGIT